MFIAIKDTSLSWQWHGTLWSMHVNIFIIAYKYMDILAWRSTKALCRVLFSFLLGVRFVCFCNAQKNDWLNVENQHKHNWGGEGVQCITTFFFDGVVRQWDGGLQRYLLWREICGAPSPSRSRRPAASAFRFSDSQLEPRFILELQERVKGKCYLTHGLEGLDVDILLHKDEMLECNSGIVVDQVAVERKRAPWDSLDETPPLICIPIP